MKKSDKRQTYKLKFDTSQANLSCFIKKKNKSTSGQEDRKSNRRKNKFCKDKTTEFQSGPFITSVLTNIFTQDFGEKDIKQLVMNSKLHEPEEEVITEFRNINENTFDPTPCFINPLCTEKCPVVTWKDSIDSQYRPLLCQYDQIEGISKPMVSTRINTEQTHRSRYTLTPQQMSSDQKADNNRNSTTLEITKNYNQMYDPYKQFYPHQSFYQTQQRKRKTLAGEQNNQFKIYLQKIQLDGRTTLMIRNIPNKYAQEMLVDELNRNNKHKYNFFYLPIDYNNSCNVGYAFINFIHTKFIPQFYEEFNGRKWSKFNSEKICSLAYARIQGTASLLNHFQYSSLVNHRDRKVRPIVQLGPATLSQLSQIVQEQKQQNIDKTYF